MHFAVLCQFILGFVLLIDQEPQTELVAQLSQEVYNNNILLELTRNIHKLDFEVRQITRWRIMFDIFRKAKNIIMIIVQCRTMT